MAGALGFMVMFMLVLLVISGEGRVLSREYPEGHGAFTNTAILQGEPSREVNLQALQDPSLLWVKCKTIKEFGEVCVGIYGDPTSVPSTLGVELTFLNKTYFLPVLGAKACLNDAVLLNLLLTDPHFAAFAKQIQALITAEKLLAAEAVSECVLFTDADVAEAADGSLFFSACPQLDSRWGCFRGRCLFIRTNHFECFKVRLPHKRAEEGEGHLLAAL